MITIDEQNSYDIDDLIGDIHKLFKSFKMPNKPDGVSDGYYLEYIYHPNLKRSDQKSLSLHVLVGSKNSANLFIDFSIWCNDSDRVEEMVDLLSPIIRSTFRKNMGGYFNPSKGRVIFDFSNKPIISRRREIIELLKRVDRTINKYPLNKKGKEVTGRKRI